MPSAMSRPSDPVEMVSISTASREPSFIALPLPKARSICARAASRAFCLSILSEVPVTNFRDAVMASLPVKADAPPIQRVCSVRACTMFVPEEQVENDSVANRASRAPRNRRQRLAQVLLAFRAGVDVVVAGAGDGAVVDQGPGGAAEAVGAGLGDERV